VTAADVRPGDKVRLTINERGPGTYTVEGVAYLSSKGSLLVGRRFLDWPGDRTVEVLERAVPAEPSVKYVLDNDGVAWAHDPGGAWRCCLPGGTTYTWADLCHTYGPLRPLTAGDPL
jgi:hypothetical protein